MREFSVSVVIPCYKQAQFLGDAIESVLAQSHPAYEVVVIDDGSPDDTAAVVAEYPFVSCIKQENSGLAAARNSGLRETTGPLLVFLDADDRLLPDALAVGVHSLAAHPDASFAWGRCEFIDERGAPCEWVEPDGSTFTEAPPYAAYDDYRELLTACVIWTPGVVMWRRSTFQEVGNFNASVSAAADWQMYLRVARSHPIHCHNKLVLQYRRHGENMTRNLALLLEASLRVLQAERSHAERVPEHRKAWLRGLQNARDYYGEPLATQALDLLRQGETEAALAAISALREFHPAGAQRVQSIATRCFRGR